MQLTDFHNGDRLVVRPHDQRDPESLAHAQHLCVFQRYSVGIMLRMVVVECEDGKRLYLREEDVIPEQKELAL